MSERGEKREREEQADEVRQWLLFICINSYDGDGMLYMYKTPLSSFWTEEKLAALMKSSPSSRDKDGIPEPEEDGDTTWTETNKHAVRHLRPAEIIWGYSNE
jgi:hypothetical protein